MVKPLAVLFVATVLQSAVAAFPPQKFYALGGNTVRTAVIRHNRDYTTADMAQARDLSQYENGGSLEHPRDTKRDFSKIRRFIWRCWQHKRRGYIRDTDCSVDACATSHIFIEPRADGKWHIAWRVAHGSNLLTDMPEITSVTWEERQRWDKPGKRVLVFTHPEGYEIQRM